MKKIFATLVMLVQVFFAFSQDMELISSFSENMRPDVGGTDNYKNTFTSNLKDKYDIDFRFSKVNSVAEEICVFVFSSQDNLQPAPLEEGGDFPYEIYNADKTVYIKAKFVKFIKNDDVPVESQAQVEFKVYRKGKSGQSNSSVDKNGFGYEKPNLNGVPSILLWATQYLVHQAPYTDTGISLKNVNGSPTGAKLTLCDWCNAALEGTVLTTDKNGKKLTLNFAKQGTNKQVDCGKCFKKYGDKGLGRSLYYVAKGTYGDGVNGLQLIPFRTVAVDKTKIPIGSLIFIPDAVGVEIILPDGSKSKHDGYFFAADVGGAIKLNHIDVFTGLYSKNPFGFIKSNSTKTFKAYLIPDGLLKQSLQEIHKLN